MKNEAYAQRIRKHRDERQFTQELMAYQLGIKQHTYSNLESGKIKIKAETLEQIAEILQIPLSKLLEDLPPEELKTHQNDEKRGGQMNEEKIVQERRLWQTLDEARIETILTLKNLLKFYRKVLK